MSGLISHAMLYGRDKKSISVIKPLSVTKNGKYEVPDGVDGFNPVEVKVDSGGGGGGGGDSGDRVALIEEAETLAELQITTDGVWTAKIKHSEKLYKKRPDPSNYGMVYEKGTYRGMYTGEQVFISFYKNGEFRFAHSLDGEGNGVVITSYSNSTPSITYKKGSSGGYYKYRVYGVEGISVNRFELEKLYLDGDVNAYIALSYTKFERYYNESGEITSEKIQQYVGTSATYGYTINPEYFTTGRYPNAISRGGVETFYNDVLDMEYAVAHDENVYIP